MRPYPAIFLIPLSFVPRAAADDERTFAEMVAPVLESHCIDCHGAEKQKGRVRFDAFTGYQAEDGPLWTKVHEVLSAGEMPPEDKPQPGRAEVERLLAWIEESQRGASDGEMRRLNRRELSAALQDLTGLPIDFGAGLPEDGRVGGFDTGVRGLQDAADSVAQMLEVTRRAVESIRFTEPASARVLRIDFREHAFTDFRKWIEQRFGESGIFTRSKRLTCREGIGIFLNTEWSGDRGDSFLALPAPADKRAAITLKLRVASRRPFPGLPQPILWVKAGGDYVDYRPVSEEPQTLEYALRMEDCLIEDGAFKIMLRSVVEMPYAVPGFENDDRSKPEEKIPGGIGVYRPRFDRKILREPDQQPVPVTVVEEIEIDYDHRASWPPADWEAEVGEIDQSESSARRLLALWLERAWRRPARDSDAEPFLALFRNLRTEGAAFDEALRSAFQAVLMSGGFRYFARPGDTDPVAAQHAIASRLSFMLTGAPPNRELRRLAAAGELRDPATLDTQVDRLLEGSGSDGFFRPFAIQWLQLEQPITLTMSHFQKQDFRFGRHLKDSMREESVQYVARLFRENRPARELVASDWTMANDILAAHYGLPALEGAQLRMVSLKNDAPDPRGGGLLGHAGIQSMLCWMGDNWVIYRGAWLLDRLLDDPPPPPPLDVPELNPSEGENRGKSLRELLAKHQEDARCAVCHESIDPLGFAFQNFDLSGRWRDLEYHRYIRNELDGKIEWRGEGDTRAVDAIGMLPRGETFSGYAEFKQQLEEHYLDDIVRGLLKNFTLYGTGRMADALDLAEIRRIMDAQRPRGYPLRDLIKTFVRSPIFLEPPIDRPKK